MKLPGTLIRRSIDWLLARAPRAVWMAVPCLLGFQVLWRVAPEAWAIPTYAAAGPLILLAMAVLRYRVPDAAFTLVVALVLFSGFCVLQGELTLARIMCGGILVVLFLVALGAIEEQMDKALALGQGVTILMWFAGNANRGSFGPEIARSALGQAYGPWAEALGVAVILAGYAYFGYNNHKANTA